MKNPIMTGTLTALAAATLFAGACSKQADTKTAAPTTEVKTAAMMHCEGANACKGQSGCKSAKNACKGQNACKAQGFTQTASAEECKTAGGTPVEVKM